MDSSNLSGYPFGNCPEDILRLIFEATFTCSDNGFEAATAISQVSIYWRHIAFSTPLLWTDVTFSSFNSFEPVQDLLRRTLGRVGERGVFLFIKDVFWSKIYDIRRHDLSRIPNIEYLKLHVHSYPPKSFSSLPEFIGLKKKDIRKLEIIFDDYVTTEMVWQAVNLPVLFPNLHHLSLDCANFIFLMKTGSLPTVTSFVLRRTMINWPTLLPNFPNLEKLELDDSESNFYHEIPFPLSMNKLKMLRLRKCILGGWLDLLNCPIIRELWCEDSKPSLDTLPFIRINPSITTLKLKADKKAIILAEAAPRLEHLTVYSLDKQLWSSSTGSLARLPRLRTLTITDFAFQLLTKDFEDLVRTRCLPKSHPGCEISDGSEPLEVLGVLLLRRNKPSDTNWGETSLYKEAKSWVETEELWDDCVKVCMSWV